MIDPAGGQRGAQRFGDVLLPHHLGERRRAVLAIQSERHRARLRQHTDSQARCPHPCRPGPVRWAGAGVAAYGIAYAVVHDVCIHGRLTGGRPIVRGRWLRHVAAAHAVHHRWGETPYGFLVPIVPARFRTATASFRAVGTRARLEKTS